jgi:hypothetical protein
VAEALAAIKNRIVCRVSIRRELWPITAIVGNVVTYPSKIFWREGHIGVCEQQPLTPSRLRSNLTRLRNASS